MNQFAHHRYSLTGCLHRPQDRRHLAYLLASEPPTKTVSEQPKIESRTSLVTRPDGPSVVYGNNTNACSKANTSVTQPGTNSHQHACIASCFAGRRPSSARLFSRQTVSRNQRHLTFDAMQTTQAGRQYTPPPLVTRRIGQATQRNRPTLRHKDEWSCAIHVECRFLSRGRIRPPAPARSDDCSACTGLFP